MRLAEFYGKPQPKAAVKDMLTAAYTEYGVTFFDTVDMYGKGLSEQLLGEAIAPFRDHMYKHCEARQYKCLLPLFLHKINQLKQSGFQALATLGLQKAFIAR